MIFVRLESSPVRQLYSSRDVLPFLDPSLPRHDLLTDFGPITASAKVGGGNEVSYVNVSCRNQSLEFSRLFPIPPVGIKAIIYEVVDGAAVELYSGTINGISDSQVYVLELEAERLTELVPLRQSTVWDVFREPVTIPHVYGRGVTSRLIQYNQNRTLFVWADHSCQGIDEVKADGLDAVNWQSYPDQDSTGRRVQFVEFQSPQDEGVELWATGRGKIDSRTGALIESPADVITDLRANICGHSFTAADIDEYRTQCKRLGIVCAGVIKDRETVRSTIDAICNSVGAVWDDTARGFAWTYPGEIGAYVRRVIPGTATVSSTASLADVVTRISCGYAVNHATGEPQASLEIRADEPLRAYGDRPLELVLPWVNSSRVAYAVCERLLKHRARPQLVVSFDAQPKVIRPIDSVRFDHASVASTDPHPVTSVLISADGKTSGTVTIPTGPEPSISLVRRTEAIGPESYIAASVQTQGDQVILTVLGPDDVPLAGFAVTLDGQYERTTDAGGRVSYPRSIAPRGVHALSFTYEGAVYIVDVTIG